MKITNKTTLEELLPKGFELTGNLVVYTIYDTRIVLQIAPCKAEYASQVYQKDLDQALKSAMSAIRPQDECCRQCGQYNGHAIHCVFNIAEF
jgi:hypothetical protein